jgi:glycine/D-amino acid oxidase-like deaminating enzyme
MRLKCERTGMMDPVASAAITADATSSWWLQHLPPDLAPPASTALPTTADVLIVGAGMTGCATAYWLQKLYGRSSIVLDARCLCGGATGRNGGHLWANPSSEFECDTVADLVAFIEAEGIDCDLTSGGAAALDRRAPEVDVEYHDTDRDPELAKEEEDWGDTPAWDAAQCEENLQSPAFSAATVYAGAKQMYPAKVAAALLRASGAALFAPVRVLRVGDAADVAGGAVAAAAAAAGTAADATAVAAHDDAPLAVVVTDRGAVTARAVVVCTNGWAGEILPELREHLYPVRNQVLMTAPVPAAAVWPVGGMSIDSERGARELYMIRCA